MRATGTYVFCIVADTEQPRALRKRAGLPGSGPVRLVAIGPTVRSDTRRSVPSGRAPRMWAVVADVPLQRYSEDAINRRLTDLDWVSRAAVAHEAVIESFISSPAILPMKLFTIFTSDERALTHLAREHPEMQALVKRVQGQYEWGVRVVVDQERVLSSAAPRDRSRAGGASGAAYLRRKKIQHAAAADFARRFHEVVADLHDRLSRDATLARRRTAAGLPSPAAPLLLDAAYLVPRARTKKFQSAVARHARTLGPRGYAVTLSGPWPPYTFMHD